MRFMNCLPKNELSVDAACRTGFRASAADDQLSIDVLGDIGDFYGDPTAVTAFDVVPKIRAHKGSRIHMTINSDGGLVWDAIPMYYAMADHPARVTADILGKAKSAATILASAADHVRIAEGGEYMIHRAIGGFAIMHIGNRAELESSFADIVMVHHDVLEKLDAIDEEIAGTLADRSGQGVEDVRQWMIGKMDGTTFSGREAVDLGFADELIPRKSKPKKDASRATARSRDLHLVRLRYS